MPSGFAVRAGSLVGAIDFHRIVLAAPQTQQLLVRIAIQPVGEKGNSEVLWTSVPGLAILPL